MASVITGGARFPRPPCTQAATSVGRLFVGRLVSLCSNRDAYSIRVHTAISASKWHPRGTFTIAARASTNHTAAVAGHGTSTRSAMSPTTAEAEFEDTPATKMVSPAGGMGAGVGDRVWPAGGMRVGVGGRALRAAGRTDGLTAGALGVGAECPDVPLPVNVDAAEAPPLVRGGMQTVGAISVSALLPADVVVARGTNAVLFVIVGGPTGGSKVTEASGGEVGALDVVPATERGRLAGDIAGAVVGRSPIATSSGAPLRVDRRVAGAPVTLCFRRGFGRGGGAPMASFHPSFSCRISLCVCAILTSLAAQCCRCCSCSSGVKVRGGGREKAGAFVGAGAVVFFCFLRTRTSSSSSSSPPEPDSAPDSESESDSDSESESEFEYEPPSSPAIVYFAALKSLEDPSMAAEESSGASVISVSVVFHPDEEDTH